MRSVKYLPITCRGPVFDEGVDRMELALRLDPDGTSEPGRRSGRVTPKWEL